MISRLNESIASRLAARKDEDSGFTLIELLVVVLIIGILAAIAIPIFLGQQAAAKDSAAASDASNAALAENGYFAAKGSVYTATTSDLASYGFVNTTGVTVSTPTLNTGSTAFCLTTTATNSNHVYAISNTTGLTKGGSCSAGVLTAPTTAVTW